MTTIPEIIATHRSEWIKDQFIQKLEIHIYRPSERETGEWGCRVVIDFQKNHDHVICGEDSFQSLKLVFSFVKTFVAKIITGWEACELDTGETQKYIDALF